MQNRDRNAKRRRLEKSRPPDVHVRRRQPYDFLHRDDDGKSLKVAVYCRVGSDAARGCEKDKEVRSCPN
jgi:hypothetical protein